MGPTGHVVTLPLDFSSVTDEKKKEIAEAVSEAMKERGTKRSDMEKKLEALELIASYAKDVVDYWPNMSFKTIRIMIPKMQALKEALELLK